MRVLGSVVVLLLLSGSGCRGPFPEAVELDGQPMQLFETRRQVEGLLGVYALPGDHPETSNLTIGVHDHKISVRTWVRMLKDPRGYRRVHEELSWPTGDDAIQQLCLVYDDPNGQAALTLYVGEGGGSSVGTQVVWEIPNRDGLGAGRRYCPDYKKRLGAVWAVHRTVFPTGQSPR